MVYGCSYVFHGGGVLSPRSLSPSLSFSLLDLMLDRMNHGSYGFDSSTDRIMTRPMPLLPYHTECISLPSIKSLRSRFKVLSYLPKTSSRCDKRLLRRICFYYLAAPSINNFRQSSWSIRSTTDGPGSRTDGQTRLTKAVQSFRTNLKTKIKELKKGLPMKALFFLLGFYCATAFSTVIGQTGDWDILSAGLAVVVVEGTGALMYRASQPSTGRIRSLIAAFNYWKAGLSLGLFLDAFKYEIDSLVGSWNPFYIEMDVFPIFW